MCKTVFWGILRLIFLTEQLFQNISHPTCTYREGAYHLELSKEDFQDCQVCNHCNSLLFLEQAILQTNQVIDMIWPSEFDRVLGVSCCIPRKWQLDRTHAFRSTRKEVNSSSVGLDLSFSPARLPLVSFRWLDTNRGIIIIIIIIIIKTIIIISSMTAVQR